MKHENLLKLACILMLSLGLNTVTHAESVTPPTAVKPAEKAGKRAEKLKEALGLTDDQLGKLKTVMQSQKQELSTLKDNKALSKEDKKAQVKAIREKFKPQIAAILTPDQLAKMKELHDQRHAAKKGGTAT